MEKRDFPAHPYRAKALALFRPLQLPTGVQIYLWPLALALAVALFPFDWLADVWPAYGRLFDLVFVRARDHAVGHATMFFLVGLLVLLSVPALQRRPLLYFGLLLAVALGQEALQALFKLQLPTIWDGRDLLFDLTGTAVAYLLMWGWQWLRARQSLTAPNK